LKKLTEIEFIARSISIHGSNCNYDSVEYINNSTNVLIFCNSHNKMFSQRPAHHLAGHGCPKCAHDISANSKRLGLVEWKRRCAFTHKSYNYHKVNDIQDNIKVEILCNKGHTFFQTPKAHMQGQGCPTCAKIRVTENRTLKFKNKFLKEVGLKYGKLFDFSGIKYVNSSANIEVYCNTHCKFFQQTPSQVLISCGCSDCQHKNRSEAHSGKNSSQYKHGKTSQLRDERRNSENQKWIRDVKRGVSICDCCRSLFAEWNVACAHHLNSWSDNKEDRLKLENGVAICWECHNAFHEYYGRGGNTKEQYLQFRQLREQDHG